MFGNLYYDGQWKESASKKTMDVTNPATGEKVGTVFAAERQDAAAAVDAAARAFKTWSRLSAADRSAPLYNAYRLLTERADHVARILTMEQGKPLAEARGEVMQAADFLRWYSEEAKRIYGEIIPASSVNKRAHVIRQPIGVVAAITPWNFPASMITRKIAPALAAGCTVVIKPAEATPLTAAALFEIFHESDFPPGVVNLVYGDGPSIGAEFLENRLVKKIAFTGSTKVGKHLIAGSADQVKKVSLELGGHAPFIVFEDADLDQAVEACLISKYRNAGQTCICANRIYVQDTILETFSEKLASRVRSLKLGNGLEQGVEIGPLINEAAYRKVQEHVDDALAKGGKLLAGGKLSQAEGMTGYFYEPTLIGDASPDMKICSEETFGPVAPILTFKTENEAVEQANDSVYGLAAYVFTRDLGRTYRVAEALEYGIVGINDPLPGAAQVPFGGWKESGIGREGGHYGLEPFLEIKYISIGLNDR
ncbi:NAD-dependent succinate-semialdehyde dehydrogenase [Paenibacillus hamazuiensis]|uniref:NAD-dependent succinate-semialdehyde dehydrogenase n=1 Tax=Paenibacillus hamazuiensis TaxID=2936508 RepID=UPI00200D4A38|nr:NAD-dependent succinate-semialdehyde dehydrogenase [Paenibacillus hamazuiensis]